MTSTYEDRAVLMMLKMIQSNHKVVLAGIYGEFVMHKQDIDNLA